MELDGNTAAWAALVAFFLPTLMAVINQPQWSAQVKSGLAFLASVAVALGTVWIEGNWNAEDIVGTILLVMTVAQSTYHGFWKPTGITTGIEEGTSPSGDNDKDEE